jgi:hypothetical protein
MISSFRRVQGVYRFRILGGVQDSGKAIQTDTVNSQVQIRQGGGAGLSYGQIFG